VRKGSTAALAAWPLALACVATFGAFATYTATYAARKAFAGGTYAGNGLFGLDYKSALVMAQIIGYTLSKWLGVKVVAEADHESRGRLILLMVGCSVASLFLFAVLPPALGPLCMLVNGLPIGMIFGLIFGYLEGRRITEVLVTGLTATQIFSSGLVKSIGSWMIAKGIVANNWMPFTVALLFVPLLLLGVRLLRNLPPPDAADLGLKSPRLTMNRKQRMDFVRRFLPGLALFMVTYILLTAYRDYRDNFAADIWQALGSSDGSFMMTATEIPVTVLLFFLMVVLQRMTDNRKAFRFIHLTALAGAACGLSGTLAYGQGWIGSALWVSLTGLGLYLAYVPLNTIFFERMIAVFRYPGNAGFVVILADFFGYCGSFGVLLFKNFGSAKGGHAPFFYAISIAIPAATCIALLGSYLYYFRRKKKEPPVKPVQQETGIMIAELQP